MPRQLDRKFNDSLQSRRRAIPGINNSPLAYLLSKSPAAAFHCQ